MKYLYIKREKEDNGSSQIFLSVYQHVVYGSVTNYKFHLAIEKTNDEFSTPVMGIEIVAEGLYVICDCYFDKFELISILITIYFRK